MRLQKFLSLGADEAISPAEAQLLNEELSKISAADIPVNKRTEVSDYLNIALRLNSVRKEIIPKLELLYTELQRLA
jgi:hypothetical protein